MARGRTPKKEEIPSISKIKKHVKNRLKVIEKIAEHDKKVEKAKHEFIKTGISGLDTLIEFGIPKGASILVAGGAGAGKTILCLQILSNAAKNGEKCLYISFEESEERLKQHMEDFGWDWRGFEKKGLVKFARKEPLVLASNIEAMVAKARGELLIDINEILEISPKGFHPDRIFMDSVSALSAAFANKEEGYRIFIEQLFRYFESLDATIFLISETGQIPVKYSPGGVEEFLADGLIVLYNVRQGDIISTVIEVVKIRGTKINKRIVPFRIQTGKGIEVYPEETVFEKIKSVV